MSQESPQKPNSDVVQQWLNLRHYWQSQCLRYEQEIEQSSDPKKLQALQAEIETCQGIIQNCQKVIEQLAQHNEQGVSEGVGSGVMPNIPLSMVPPVPVDDGQTVLPMVAEAGEMVYDRSSAIATSASSPTLPLSPKHLLGLVVPLLLLGAIFVVLLQPEDKCRLAPDGSYHASGLSLWVQADLQTHPQYSNTLKTLSVSQHGCTIILKGTIPTRQDRDALIQYVKTITISSPSPLNFFDRGKKKMIQPITEVISELKIGKEDSE